ncbi:LytTR family DNA-binding domain-containing protein [Maribacter confluentis]|uniref:LytTR family DNA-binding domain-containing protein n=1 Tax=Maribacter confluentis TaxID=1656093 RepID=A0ABT8RV90_9FLAO|nr:LytTR family DNA-binding domain-containing protein [Maribacter confluentis]MDO1513406.1 LytTR family DNA-binding domain-containing protein [Maribacter confluentis]MDO1514856.1 LytTR family DNA-binding domain-containing protein [Maribacter confluentis]
MINCIIIEDQPPAQRVLKKYIADFGNMELKGTFADGLQALEFLKRTAIDLIFLDIHLPKISGIEFLKVLKHRPNIILTTAFADYALESYEYDVVDYLLKPFSFERFVQAVSKVPTKNNTQMANSLKDKEEHALEHIFIKSGYEHIKVDVYDIEYIQSDADYTEIITKTRKYLSQEPLRYWEEFLGANRFVRIHKSYIINMAKIHKINGNQVFLKGGVHLPLGRAYKEGFMALVLQ